MQPTHVAVLWHMHQPDYRDPETNRLSMPWARMHALKGYYDMVRLLDDVDERVRVVFNLVPVLVRQLQSYLDGSRTDAYREVSLKPAADLTPDERRFVALSFFHANRRTMIDCYPRYAELRLRALLPGGQPRELPPEDLRDLIVWFNLTWFGYSARRDFPRVYELIRKGRRFTEEDREEVLSLQRQVMERVIPLYRRAAEQGRAELTTTPFYHPILPLVCDTNAASRGLPGRPLPEPPFSAPEDARVHVARAVAHHWETFGRAPEGMWPAEGSVSPDAVAIFAENGIKWVATDQDVLARSDPKVRPTDLYRPHTVGEAGRTVSMVFRDRDISDAIGFRYSGMAPQLAAEDFMGRLRAIRGRFESPRRPLLVPIILDGENAWEYYPDGGEALLRRMYQAVAESDEFRWTTISEYLAQYPPDRAISRVFPGSWIGGNFDVWIGSPEENRAWGLLRQTREALVAANDRLVPEVRERAWEAIYAAEGSDWFWWYGDDFTSVLQPEFDRLFRAHLAEVYRLIGQPVPRGLLTSNRRDAKPTGLKPADLVTPVIDGRSTSFYEWAGAGEFDALKAHGAMAQGQQVVRAIHYGADHRLWHLRIDTTRPPRDVLGDIIFVCEFPGRPQMRLILRAPDTGSAGVQVTLLDRGQDMPMTAEAQADAIIECSVPFMALGFAPGSIVDFVLVVHRDGAEIERWPRDGLLSFDVPSSAYELDHWTV